MICVDHLCYHYKGGRPILRDVSFELEAGHFLAVLGNNGVGKSTLLKCMNRILTADSGHCRIDGEDLLTLSHREIAKRVAFVAQHVPDTQMTVHDMVMLGRRPYMTWGVTEHDHHVVHEAMRYLNLEDMRGRFLNRLSGGERQKVMLARALAQEVESKAYALTDELRQIQKDERMSTQQKAQRAREIAKKESEKLFMGTEVVHNPVKEFVSLKEVKVGQEVCIAELNQLATVLSLPDKNGDVLVRAGIIKTKVPLKGLKQPEKLVKETKPQTKAQQRYSRLTGDANRPNGRVERVQRTAKMECNLLGLTVDEALPEVDSFIDRAILNGQTVVYLIHGNGTGALRTAIHKHLRGNRMVKSFRLGRYGEGESGVTVVELK